MIYLSKAEKIQRCLKSFSRYEYSPVVFLCSFLTEFSLWKWTRERAMIGRREYYKDQLNEWEMNKWIISEPCIEMTFTQQMSQCVCVSLHLDSFERSCRWSLHSMERHTHYGSRDTFIHHVCAEKKNLFTACRCHESCVRMFGPGRFPCPWILKII